MSIVSWTKIHRMDHPICDGVRKIYRVSFLICPPHNRFTNDIGYVPYVVTTIPFPFMNVTYRIRLFYGFVIT